MGFTKLLKKAGVSGDFLPDADKRFTKTMKKNLISNP
jgi:hypothetical protein